MKIEFIKINRRHLMGYAIIVIEILFLIALFVYIFLVK